jgi:hypothetical protein
MMLAAAIRTPVQLRVVHALQERPIEITTTARIEDACYSTHVR